jgi:phosphoribosylformimino-5-aminoimidazole carboxamide ribotide isomerase
MIDIIPAIDIIDGSCIRLSQGDFSRQITYSNDPVTVARTFEDMGLTRLHLVDLDGARSGRIANLHILESVARSTDLRIDFSGGIQTDEDMRRVFDAGAVMAGIGSLAVRDPELIAKWTQLYGPEKILLGADVRNENLCVRGWQEDTSVNVGDFIARYSKIGLRQVFCTDVGKDGMMNGPATGLYQSLCARFPDMHLIASGGIAAVDDIISVSHAGCKGVIIGKAFYEGAITAKDLKPFIS